MGDSIVSLRISAIAISLLGAGMLILRFRRGVLLSAVSGLHLTMFLCFGVAPLCYTFYEAQGERVNWDDLIPVMSQTNMWLLLGYVIAIMGGFMLLRLTISQLTVPIRKERISLVSLVPVILVSLVGFLATSALGNGTSGASIIFPALRNFYYPAVTLAILGYNRREPVAALIVASLLLGCSGLALFSSWRSDLIFFVVSVALGLTLRKAAAAIPLVIASFAFLVVIIPFQNFKKIAHEETKRDPWAMFVESQHIDMGARREIILDFFGSRLNYTREMAYVANGVEQELVDLRGGATYVEALLQLIPRAIWRDKPSFNQFSGYYLCRAIGLLAQEDPETSWSVNSFAEYLWNFPIWSLIIFTPAVFILFGLLDIASARLSLSPSGFALLETSLFFQTFQLVTIVSATTFLLWTFIFVYVLDVLLKAAGFVRPVGPDNPPEE